MDWSGCRREMGDDSDARAWEGSLFTEDDDAVFTGDIAFHEVLFGCVSESAR